MKIKNQKVFDEVVNCLDDLRKKLRKEGASREAFEDIATVEAAMWDAIEPDPPDDVVDDDLDNEDDGQPTDASEDMEDQADEAVSANEGETKKGRGFAAVFPNNPNGQLTKKEGD